ncbi:O-acetyl-ADP-ribose deacetylase [Hydrogenothermus marinus]|uniref:O-acetyl-ADP-ribose deacetylase (Regulator of RNase III) n=1 Tax=Hydrogenothermus marinus TaxID=133270 RepID=A0A3M0B8S0_9AQUI|nr:O-acetyl-ADP-ribose deacetylase [Hydrogenothermus marinus]RMA92529.1 O-acetyl-ADP-ribose deacetylase (regulator of RNase III) [Hydrogenothermus marinus]
MQVNIGNTQIILKKGDITEEKVDAIVNAANSTLMGGGGVDGAIHLKGGPSILEECKKIRQTIYPEGLPTGEAVITTAGNLPSNYVIHTVGPICNGKWDKEKEKLLFNSYYNSLKLAKEKGLQTIAFPFISAGVYRCPKEEASKTALKATIEFIKKENFLKEIRFILFSENDYRIFEKNLKEIIK